MRVISVIWHFWETMLIFFHKSQVPSWKFVEISLQEYLSLYVADKNMLKIVQIC